VNYPRLIEAVASCFSNTKPISTGLILPRAIHLHLIKDEDFLLGDVKPSKITKQMD